MLLSSCYHIVPPPPHLKILYETLQDEIQHVLIKCYLASKDEHETETVLCKQKLNQRSVLGSTQIIALTVENLTIVCCNSCALHR